MKDILEKYMGKDIVITKPNDKKGSTFTLIKVSENYFGVKMGFLDERDEYYFPYNRIFSIIKYSFDSTIRVNIK